MQIVVGRLLWNGSPPHPYLIRSGHNHGGHRVYLLPRLNRPILHPALLLPCPDSILRGQPGHLGRTNLSRFYLDYFNQNKRQHNSLKTLNKHNWCMVCFQSVYLVHYHENIYSTLKCKCLYSMLQFSRCSKNCAIAVSVLERSVCVRDDKGDL